MTVDLATLGTIAGITVPVAGLTGWVVRRVVMDRIERVEASIRSFGERLQGLREWQIEHDAVERERRRADTRGVPRGDGE